MILFIKWAKHKAKSLMYCANQFLREKCHKKWNQECKQKQSFSFKFFIILDLLTSTNEKTAKWFPAFKPHFDILSYKEQLGKI